ncbi:hypothetical protein [Usitatibacter rugosus]|uniref:hypothetical protein n=1 Tax=Usitatibacter rugosus TaxID=2732067 RepID=UPI001489841B|nr:hypothetical protein [Usitatibacter rugosus]
MNDDDNPKAIFPFDYFDPIKRRWVRARWKAKKADIEARGGRIVGPGWVPRDVDGRHGPSTDTDRSD